MFKVCKNSHSYESRGHGCPICRKVRLAKWLSANPEHKKAAFQRYYEKNRAAILARQQRIYLVEKQRYSERAKIWRLKNRGLNNLKGATYHASKLKRTPGWLSLSQRREMTEIYNLAAELSWLSEGGLHVDHIVPLRGREVSGLHVPWNLQIIPASENLKKYNRTAEVSHRVHR